MAQYYGLRLRLMAAATAFCGSIAGAAADALEPEHSMCGCDGTYSVTIGEIVVLEHKPTFLLAPVIDPNSIKGDFPVERRARVQSRAVGNSGRARQLASR